MMFRWINKQPGIKKKKKKKKKKKNEIYAVTIKISMTEYPH